MEAFPPPPSSSSSSALIKNQSAHVVWLRSSWSAQLPPRAAAQLKSSLLFWSENISPPVCFKKLLQKHVKNFFHLWAFASINEKKKQRCSDLAAETDGDFTNARLSKQKVRMIIATLVVFALNRVWFTGNTVTGEEMPSGVQDKTTLESRLRKIHQQINSSSHRHYWSNVVQRDKLLYKTFPSDLIFKRPQKLK